MCPRAFLGKLCTGTLFFFSLRTALGGGGAGSGGLRDFRREQSDTHPLTHPFKNQMLSPAAARAKTFMESLYLMGHGHPPAPTEVHLSPPPQKKRTHGERWKQCTAKHRPSAAWSHPRAKHNHVRSTGNTTLNPPPIQSRRKNDITHQFFRVKCYQLQPILEGEGKGNTEGHCSVCSPIRSLRPKKRAVDTRLGMGIGVALGLGLSAGVSGRKKKSHVITRDCKTGPGPTPRRVPLCRLQPRSLVRRSSTAPRWSTKCSSPS